jgi:hypothetical protein
MDKFGRIIELLKKASSIERIGTILYKASDHIKDMRPDETAVINTVADVRAKHLRKGESHKKIVGVLV